MPYPSHHLSRREAAIADAEARDQRERAPRAHELADAIWDLQTSEAAYLLTADEREALEQTLLQCSVAGTQGNGDITLEDFAEWLSRVDQYRRRG